MVKYNLIEDGDCYMKKVVSLVLACMMVISCLIFSGCSADTTEAENSLKAYLSSLKGFNTDAMKTYVVGDEEGEIGFTTDTFSADYIQTDNYKNAVESMFKALGSTISYEIDAVNSIDENQVNFDITLKCADVNEEAMNEYIQKKVDTYLERNPGFYYLNEIEQNDTMIQVQADSYKQFLQITQKETKNFTLTVSKVGESWKVKVDQNRDFFKFLSQLFAE